MNIRFRPAHVPGPHEDSPLPTSALPHGLFRTLRFRTAGCGELRLAVAVLEDAVRTLERHRDARDFVGRLLRWEAEEWFRSTDIRPLFSFENICRILDLDAAELREHLRRWRERLAGAPGASSRLRVARFPARAHVSSPEKGGAVPAGSDPISAPGSLDAGGRPVR